MFARRSVSAGPMPRGSLTASLQDRVRIAAEAHCRRHFLGTAGYGIGTAALAALLAEDSARAAATHDPLAPTSPPLPAKAKRCIFIFLEGAPSQIDLYDPKPKLVELHGQPLPESMTQNVRFAFIKK
jgi:hypothetical protein